MNRSAKFYYVQVAQLAEANDFFQNRLGMDTEQTFLSEQEKCILVKPDHYTSIFLSEQKHDYQTAKVLIPTTDLLEDYCKLKANGIEFSRMPVYLNEGLSATFSDPYGNEYIILEYRNYTED
ncbi:VOC family protein [Pedobacter agri]|uniref:VOC family protein n=1 Tax=Pedobacter agri TaxID=454586 RepID=UPI002931DABB|nr:VOC family protein [Pedobacter agri]